jgi:glycosyltransferase involved in cell wall biosynthesis
MHFTDSLDPSGVGEHIYLLARELRAHGYAQSLVCPEGPAARPLLERCATLGLQVYALCVRCAADIQAYTRLVRLLRQGQYDLFHNHAGITWEGCWGTFAAAEAGVPVICTEHLPYLITEPRERALKLQASRRVLYTIGVSRGVASSLVEHGVVPAERARVVWNGIDFTRFSPVRQPELRRSLLGLDLESHLVVCVGRMTPQKGHALLLDAVALARRELPRLTVALAGDGPLAAELQARATRLGLGDAALFLGRYRHVPELLSCTDVLVQPSIFEGLPLAVLEGMAAALPVVVTDVVGNREAVVSGESGLVVPPDDPLALARALLRLVLDPHLAARLGMQARQRAAREFTAPVMARRTQAVYDDAVGARRAAA